MQLSSCCGGGSAISQTMEWGQKKAAAAISGRWASARVEDRALGNTNMNSYKYNWESYKYKYEFLQIQAWIATNTNKNSYKYKYNFIY